MNILRCFALFCILSFSQLSAQQGVFEYFDYYVIPTQYEFQTKENEYQINSLLRYLFKEEGFDVFMDKETLPEEYKTNACKGLRVDLEKEFAITHYYVTIKLYDCQNKIVLGSRGKSNSENLKTAYQEAIREAFLAIEKANLKIDNASLNTNTDRLTKEEKQALFTAEVKQKSSAYQVLDSVVYFYKNGKEIEIYNQDVSQVLGKLTPIEANMFIYNSDEINGVMTEKENGNFELEYRAITSKQPQILIYSLVEKPDLDKN